MQERVHDGSERDQERGGSKKRLQRVMADAGIAARRLCEDMIEEGRVSVNGEVTKRLPVFVNPETDDIIVDGRPLRRPERKLYVMVHKPERMLVTSADEPEFDRATIMEIVDHPAKARLFPVGRLDFDSAGLVLMTNDGELAHKLTHPRFGIVKIYEALVRGVVDNAAIDAIKAKFRGVRKRAARDSGMEGPVASGAVPEFSVVKRQGANTIVRITLTEAKNRELREVLEFLGMPIKKLSRIAIGGLELSGLAPATWRELTREEIQMLRKPKAGYVKPRVVVPTATTPATPTTATPSDNRAVASPVPARPPRISKPSKFPRTEEQGRRAQRRRDTTPSRGEVTPRATRPAPPAAPRSGRNIGEGGGRTPSGGGARGRRAERTEPSDNDPRPRRPTASPRAAGPGRSWPKGESRTPTSRGQRGGEFQSPTGGRGERSSGDPRRSPGGSSARGPSGGRGPNRGGGESGGSGGRGGRREGRPPRK